MSDWHIFMAAVLVPSSPCCVQVQLADEYAKVRELQVQLNSLQQRCDACAEVVHCMNASPYWKPKNELENLVEAQRKHVFLKVSCLGVSSH